LDHYIPGAFGLYVFFILSGYLITTLLIKEDQKFHSISIPLFYARRTLRIFPPLYAVFFSSLIFLWLTSQLGGVTFPGALSQALYFSNYDNLLFHGRAPGIIPGLGPLWSLAVEEHFYLLFPAFVVLMLYRFRLTYKRMTVALLLICLTDLVWRIFVMAHFSRLLPHGVALSWAEHGSDTRADSLLFGCALAFLEQTEWRGRIFEERRLKRVILPCCLFILLLTFVIRSDLFRSTIRYTMQGIALAPLLFYVVHYPTTFAGKVLNTRLLSWMGTRSYALYLIHLMVLTQIADHISGFGFLLRGTIGLAIAIVLAEIVHILVEVPTENIRARLKRKSAQETKPVHSKEAAAEVALSRR
jgi:peptidoglycan/LPS O-acetylase OafA/YrhL